MRTYSQEILVFILDDGLVKLDCMYTINFDFRSSERYILLNMNIFINIYSIPCIKRVCVCVYIYLWYRWLCIYTMANGRAGLHLHPRSWWSKESTINKRKMVWGEIHHLKEVMHIATAVGQRKWAAWIKWESEKDRAVTWGNLKHMEPQKLSFLRKAVYDVLPTPVNLHAWGLTTSN